MPAVDKPPHTTSLPDPLRLFLIGVLILTLACLATEAFCRHTAAFHHLPYTGSTLDPREDFADFSMFNVRFQHFHHREFFSPQWGSAFLYPATVAMLYELFFAIPARYPGIVFLTTIILGVTCLAFWLGRALHRRGLSNNAALLFIGVTLACSYPLYFVFNRANVEFFLAIFTGLGVLAFLRDKPWQAATWIALAGACKFYPFVYLGLLITRRQYKQAAYALVLAIFFTLASLWALTGSIPFSYAATSAGVEQFRQIYILRKRFLEVGLDHSIFGVYKRFAPHLPPPQQLAHTLTLYLAVAAILATILFFTRVIKLPVLNQVLFLTIACITLPPLSYDYTLLHLYTPFLLLVFLIIDRHRRSLPPPRGTTAVVLSFILLLAPLNEIILHGERISGQLKCLTLLTLAALSLLYRFEAAPPFIPTEVLA